MIYNLHFRAITLLHFEHFILIVASFAGIQLSGSDESGERHLFFVWRSWLSSVGIFYVECALWKVNDEDCTF